MTRLMFLFAVSLALLQDARGQVCGMSQPLQSGSTSLRFKTALDPPTKQGEFPWMVAVMKRSSSGAEAALCSGFMIDRRHVLSAAHCFEQHTQPDLYSIEVGDIYYFAGLTYNIANITIHEGYNPRLLYNDIAVLTLDKDVDFPGFSPICLPDEELDRKSLEDFSYTAASWGATKEDVEMSPMLVHTHGVPIVPNNVCNRAFSIVLGSAFQRQFPQGITESILCARSVKTCHDSGGPLMLQDKDRWIAVGISSFGFRCFRPEYPTGYTRISSYLDWIREKTQS